MVLGQSFLSKIRPFGFGGLVLAYLFISWLASRGVHVHVGGDTTAYEEVARYQLSWSNIFSTKRPPLYPLLFDIVDFSRVSVIILQFLLSFGAWIFLASVLAGRNLILAALVFYVALYPGFAAWNHVLMTESIEISLAVVAFGFLLRFLDGSRSGLWLFVSIMVFKCFLRGFDTFIDIFWIPVIFLFAAFGRISWLTAISIAAIFVGCFLYVNHATGGDADGTWYFALLDNIGKRVLPNPGWLKFFRLHGMPVNDTLLSMSGHWAHEENWKFWRDPDLESFRSWLTAHGRNTLTLYLAEHPLVTARLLWQNLDEVFQGSRFHLAYYFDPAYQFSMPPWPPFSALYGVGMVGGVIFAAGMLAKRMPPQLLLSAFSALTMWLTVLLIAMAAFFADPMAIDRHALPVLLQAALCVLLMARIAAGWYGAAAHKHITYGRTIRSRLFDNGMNARMTR